MTDGVPPPPPNLKPPPERKKRKNLTIKTTEFDAWEQIKGEMSWTSIMQFVRTEYLRLRNIRPVLQHMNNNERPTNNVQQKESVWDNWNKNKGIDAKNISLLPPNNNKKELYKELKSFDTTTLKSVSKDELSESYKKMNKRLGIKIR